MKLDLSHETENMESVSNRMLRGTFGPKREDVARDKKRMLNEEFHNLYALKVKLSMCFF
jgi:hypothetical protein